MLAASTATQFGPKRPYPKLNSFQGKNAFKLIHLQLSFLK